VPRAHPKGCLAGLMLGLAPIALADPPAHAAGATPSCLHHGGTACRSGARPAHSSRASRVVHAERGEASWYGPRFAGRRTASGERFDPRRLTAAHPALPLGARATVTNLANGRKVEVRITDRGPYADGRAIDLSEAAARKLGMVEDGTAPVRITATKAQVEAAARGKGERVTVAEAERPKARRRAEGEG
jgi:rare lipoprotein A (peptidoglycan hydrolase)